MGIFSGSIATLNTNTSIKQSQCINHQHQIANITCGYFRLSNCPCEVCDVREACFL